MKTLFRRVLLLLFLAGSTVRWATAQDIGTPALDPVMLGQGMTMAAAINAQANNLKAEKSRAGRASSASNQTATTRLTYTSTPALRQRTVRNAAAKFQATSPRKAQALTAAFGPGKADYGQVYSTALQGSGLRDNDAASAFAAYLEVGYAIAHGLPDTRSITPAMERGLRAQAAGIMGPKLSSPAAVAQFGEEMKLQTVLLTVGWQSSREAGPEATARYGQDVAAMFRQAGLDLTRLRMSEQGLLKP